MRERTAYGYPAVESLVFAFVKASHLFSATHPAYIDARQFAEGKRRFYSSSDTKKRGGKSNASDFPTIASLLQSELATQWATDEIATEVAQRLADYIRSYLRDFVRAVSAANISTTETMNVLRPTFFAQRFAVDLSWLEQKWGIGLLTQLLPKDGSRDPDSAPVSTALRWIRKLEGLSIGRAARTLGIDSRNVEGIMGRWESGRQKPRGDSFALMKDLYGMDQNPRYRFWFWIALVLDSAGPEFRQEIAACLGRGFDLASARAPFVELSNSRIVRSGTPESFLELDRLLCRQSNVRAPGDLPRASSALEEMRAFVDANNGVAEYHIHAMAARIAVFSKNPRLARECYSQAISLARYAEPTAAERILREFAALCAHEGFAIPLKNATDTQWLFGLHPVQIRKMPLFDDETWDNATDTKRLFDYYRYFPPQSFFTESDKPS